MNRRTFTITRGRLGFTIQEIIIAIIIIGVLSGLSYPSFINYIERIKTQEAEKILIILYEAQKDFAFENAGAYTTDLNDFDVTFPPPKSYNAPQALDANVSCNGSGQVTVIASITKPDPNGYTLFLREDDGTIMCCPLTNGNSICTTINYTTVWP